MRTLHEPARDMPVAHETDLCVLGGITFRWLDGRESTRDRDGKQVEGRWLPPGETAATFYQIPYRSLVPRGATNTLVAGRVIDADEGAYGGIRVMVNCQQTGQAAGVACALAARRAPP